MSYKILRQYVRGNNIKFSKLEKSLIKHEGFKPEIYFINYIPHFGIGHNCESNPLTEKQDQTARLCGLEQRTRLSLELLEKDIEEATKQVKKVFVNIWDLFTEEQKNALIEIVFQMGIGSFAGSKKLRKKGFKKTIAFIKSCEWEKAYIEAKNSIWFRKHRKRAERVLKGFIYSY